MLQPAAANLRFGLWQPDGSLPGLGGEDKGAAPLLHGGLVPQPLRPRCPAAARRRDLQDVWLLPALLVLMLWRRQRHGAIGSPHCWPGQWLRWGASPPPGLQWVQTLGECRRCRRRRGAEHPAPSPASPGADSLSPPLLVPHSRPWAH